MDLESDVTTFNSEGRGMPWSYGECNLQQKTDDKIDCREHFKILFSVIPSVP